VTRFDYLSSYFRNIVGQFKLLRWQISLIVSRSHISKCNKVVVDSLPGYIFFDSLEDLLRDLDGNQPECAGNIDMSGNGASGIQGSY
jgi:hypothetical protein